MNSRQALLYTRAGCHLCDQAQQVLEDNGFLVRAVDIDDHPDLQQRYHECVPVVFIDGKERFRGRVDAVLLRRLLASKG